MSVKTRRGAAGFTLVELLMATALTLTIMGAVFALIIPAHGMFHTQPEVADMQQRLRVAVDTLTRDITAAGAGMSMGPLTGPLSNYIAPVMPYRAGHERTDPTAGVFFRPDAITVLRVPSLTGQARVVSTMPAWQQLGVEAAFNCGPFVHDRVCGFARDMPVLLLERRGAWDTARITDVQGASLQLRHVSALSSTYGGGGAAIAEAQSHTYYLRRDAVTRSYQLMHYDGHLTDLPVLDHVVGLRFVYYGEAAPPAVLAGADLSSPDGPWTSYGVAPPPLDVDVLSDSWPAGENCIFTAGDGAHMSRLALLGVPGSLVWLDPRMLSDGPWCPDAMHPNRFDADLFRIRRVEVTVRVEAALASMRGQAGVLFTQAGSASSATRLAPDLEVTFAVAPRNLNLAR